MAAPIAAAERRFGVLTVWSPRPPIFAEADMELLQLTTERASLEDVFRKLTTTARP